LAESILDGIAIDVELAAATAKSVQTLVVQPIALTFARSVDDLMNLLSLPLVLLTVGVSEAHRLVFFTQALVRTRNATRWADSPDARAEVQAEVRRLAEEARQDPESKFKPVDDAHAQLGHLLEHHQLDAPARALLFAAVALAWASFECAAKDAWIAALNSRPLQLAQSAFGSLPEGASAEGISGRQIGVGLLARYGFDLRDKLGTLLAPKFDFTSVSGIRGAYSAAFGKQADHEIALTDPPLGLLEATRHLIVHRAGLVDEEYHRRTGDATPIGQVLQLNGFVVSNLANVGVSAGCKLLHAVDRWLTSHPA